LKEDEAKIAAVDCRLKRSKKIMIIYCVDRFVFSLSSNLAFED